MYLENVPKRVVGEFQLATKTYYHPGTQQVLPERLCGQVSVLRDRQG